MKTLEAKLELMTSYYTELQNALFWHRNLLSRLREKNKYAKDADPDYKFLIVHWEEKAGDAKYCRDMHMGLARGFKNRLEGLK
jgi:pyrroloquinoline quinone (PQQ) biosynthesis protein C